MNSRAEDSQTQRPRSSGIGGWFAYDGEQSMGPFDESQVLELARQRQQSLVFSRPGFQRWYPFEELAAMSCFDPEVIKRRRDQQRAWESRLGALESVAERLLVILDEGEDPGATVIHKADLSLDTSPQPQIGELIEQNNRPVPRAAKEDVQNIEPIQSSEAASKAQLDPSDEPTATAMTPPHDNVESLLTKATLNRDHDFSLNEKHSTLTPDMYELEQSRVNLQALPQDYLSLRGRLRLGAIRSSLVQAVIYPVFSLGISLCLWYRALGQELSYHRFRRFESGLMPCGLILIPIVNMWMFYRLACLLAEVEAEHGRVGVSPLIAMIMGLIPTLGVLYLQPKVNRHWRQHVATFQGKTH